MLYTTVEVSAGPRGPFPMVPTVPHTRTCCTDTVYTLSCPLHNVYHMHTTLTHVKMTLTMAVYTERDSARRTAMSRGQSAPRDFVDVESTHRTRAPASGTHRRRRSTSCSRAPRRGLSRLSAHPASTARASGGRARTSTRARAERRHRAGWCGAPAAAGACTGRGGEACQGARCSPRARASWGRAAAPIRRLRAGAKRLRPSHRVERRPWRARARPRPPPRPRTQHDSPG